MNLRVYNTVTDEQISYWGVSDFSVGEDTVTLFWPTDVDRPDEEQLHGRILSGIDANSLNRAGLEEAIEIDRNRDDHVLIEPSADFPELHAISNANP